MVFIDCRLGLVPCLITYYILVESVAKLSSQFSLQLYACIFRVAYYSVHVNEFFKIAIILQKTNFQKIMLLLYLGQHKNSLKCILQTNLVQLTKAKKQNLSNRACHCRHLCDTILISLSWCHVSASTIVTPDL